MVRTKLSAALTVLAFLGTLGHSAALAEDKVAPETAEAVTGGEVGRYSLTQVEGEVLRVDRQNGTVSVCRQKNEAWRCNPVPLAEEAYVAEINALADEVERLTARLEILEAGKNSDQKALPPGAALDRPVTDALPDEPAPAAKSPAPAAKSKDEEELDQVLDFTETAMRRFFGMVRELQKDMGSGSN